MGICISLTMNPRNPMMANPMATACDILINSNNFLSLYPSTLSNNQAQTFLIRFRASTNKHRAFLHKLSRHFSHLFKLVHSFVFVSLSHSLSFSLLTWHASWRVRSGPCTNERSELIRSREEGDPWMTRSGMVGLNRCIYRGEGQGMMRR